jgi:hypothetical protein
MPQLAAGKNSFGVGAVFGGSISLSSCQALHQTATGSHLKIRIRRRALEKSSGKPQFSIDQNDF